MRRELEQYLWDRMRDIDGSGEMPRDIIGDMLSRGMIERPKQAWRTLEKWWRKEIYEYGTTIDLGWRTQGNLSSEKEQCHASMRS